MLRFFEPYRGYVGSFKLNAERKLYTAAVDLDDETIKFHSKSLESLERTFQFTVDNFISGRAA